MRTCTWLVVGCFVAIAACGGSEGGETSGHGSMDHTTSTTGTGGTGGAGGGGEGGSGGAGGGSSGPPLAPVMTSVAPMQGALHVEWTNTTPDCEKIELDRNKDGGAFAKAYTLIGVATSQHDTSAAAPGTYCYKARCIKGAEISPDSNEKCGAP